MRHKVAWRLQSAVSYPPKSDCLQTVHNNSNNNEVLIKRKPLVLPEPRALYKKKERKKKG